MSRFAKYAWGVVLFNMAVILWGAYVRATGSGAGCGSHWPLCNGEVIPRSPAVETMIEFSHRLTSGLALILVVILFFWAFRKYPKGNPVRYGAAFSLIFIITEALVGAGLVLFSLVAFNDSIERVVSMSVHLVNTFLLLAALSLTAWWASGNVPIELHRKGKMLWLFLIAFLGVIALGVSGAITALGDTLFPAENLMEGVAQDFSETAHILVRLRVWHPVLAILNGVYILILSITTALFRGEKRLKQLATALSILFAIQLLVGLINLILLAPVPIQIIHLLLADLVWIFLVLFTAEHLAGRKSSVVTPVPSPNKSSLSGSQVH